MKKFIYTLLLVTVLVAVGGVYYTLTNLDALVETAIEKYGSEATQTAVLVDSVKIELTDGAAGIKGLTVANTQGFSMPLAFSFGEIRAGIDLKSLQEEPYIINEIAVLAPQVFVEINENNKTNLNELTKNLTAGSTSSPDKETKPSEESAKEPRLIIRRVTFADGTIQARVAALQDKEYQLKLPTLDMKDLGGSKGATASELANEILSRLTARASETVKKNIIDKKLNAIKDKAKEKIDAEKAKLEQSLDAKKQEEKQKVESKLKGLFGK
ncbi:MAG: hypothetical protein OQK25_07570 [Gammaproteobacteria bacterium]|nr:hypothetical protein [Gammaproteobacteria bacterium]